VLIIPTLQRGNAELDPSVKTDFLRV